MPEESLRESPAIQSSCHSEPLGEELLKESLVAYRDSSVVSQTQTDKKPFYSLFKKLTHKHNSTNKENAQDSKIYQHISMLAIINICFMICVFTPFAVYSSDVSQFDATQTLHTLCALFGIFLLSSSLLIYLSSFLYKAFIFKFSMLKLMSYGLSVILCIGVVYTFVLVGDYRFKSYGVLENFVFQGGAPIYGRFNKYFDLIYGLCTLGLCFVLYHFPHILRNIFAIISLWLLSLSGIYGFHIFHSSETSHLSSTELPSYNDKLLAFSKDKNILVLILDAFSGSHFEIMLEDNPTLQEHFKGFTYYHNTLATSNNTQFNTPAILGGHSYTTLSLLKQGIKRPYDSYLQAFSKIPKTLQENGYEIALYGLDPLRKEDLAKVLGDEATLAENKGEYMGAYIQQYHLQSYITQSLADYKKSHNALGTLISIGLFRAAPYTIRARIYKDERWLFASVNALDDFHTQIKYFSDIAMFPLTSNTNAQKPTFKYIKSLSSHYPWYLDHDCKPNISAQSQLPQAYKNIIVKEYQNAYNHNHYNNELCSIQAITQWLTYLKNEHIYDNSAIIIASDHGHYDSFKQILNNHGEQLGKQSDALLLVKGFFENAPLKRDGMLMSNADIASMICYFANITCAHSYPKGESRILYHSNSPFEEILSIEKAFSVKENIYEAKNWQDITSSISTP
ncbi:sulfatase-like hydrolase/transferase [Helicobacter marmotae]|uniref:Sulfatase N-terminal domain-containing protein n=1 Tax=Helicobacter marmotae TaxID=152490 RepID=A0A3D8I600_9HELI|nr:sulfatase-like hydrolase/transferase [Helicobacter marmotae]RDU60174.1 hypothetical protein CQA63_04275 [Helicobacter marmotae]